jgi:ubiquinone/menaquinone biosynthesis C-methylase UbiE/ketosteroid isomerase-like protein
MNQDETRSAVEAEIRSLVDRWVRAIAACDLATMAELRADSYVADVPGFSRFDKQQELAWARESGIEGAVARDVSVTLRRDSATAAFSMDLTTTAGGGVRVKRSVQSTIVFRRAGDHWRAMSSRTTRLDPRHEPRPRKLRPLVRMAKSLVRRILPQRQSNGSFQSLAFLPYEGGADYFIAKEPKPSTVDGELPVPPKELQLAYDYLVHGKVLVAKMLDLIHASGLRFRDGDRILDFGCGAGQLIRQLVGLAGMCEIWGVDLSARHIFWCKQNLSPPFHFATTTKVPHLPFEDRSFHLIYCGSVFTHIDDLADAWLLELHRILTPEGRLYITIHDQHTIDLFSKQPYVNGTRFITEEPGYRKYYREAFAMFTSGRDNRSQVFYDVSFFAKMASSMFEVVSVTQEAYFYQTAFVLRRKAGAARGESGNAL